MSLILVNLFGVCSFVLLSFLNQCKFPFTMILMQTLFDYFFISKSIDFCVSMAFG